MRPFEMKSSIVVGVMLFILCGCVTDHDPFKNWMIGPFQTTAVLENDGDTQGMASENCLDVSVLNDAHPPVRGYQMRSTDILTFWVNFNRMEVRIFKSEAPNEVLSTTSTILYPSKNLIDAMVRWQDGKIVSQKNPALPQILLNKNLMEPMAAYSFELRLHTMDIGAQLDCDYLNPTSQSCSSAFNSDPVGTIEKPVYVVTGFCGVKYKLRIKNQAEAD